MVKNPPANVGDKVHCRLGGEDPLEEEMATHSSILAEKIPWTEESGGLQSVVAEYDSFEHAHIPRPSPPPAATHTAGRLKSKIEVFSGTFRTPHVQAGHKLTSCRYPSHVNYLSFSPPYISSDLNINLIFVPLTCRVLGRFSHV